AESRGEALVLVRKLASERKRGINFRLRVDLEILSYPEIEGQARADLKGVGKVEAEVGHVEREFRIARTLKQRVVLAQGEAGKTAEGVGAAEGSVLPSRVGIKAAEREIGKMRVAELDAELQGVLSTNISEAIGELPLGFVGAAACESGVAKFER